MGTQTRFTIVDHASNNVLADDLTIDEAAEFIDWLPDIESHDVHVYPVQTDLRSRWNGMTKRQRILELEAECRGHADEVAQIRRRAERAEQQLADVRKALGMETELGIWGAWSDASAPAVTSPRNRTVFYPQNT